MTATSTRRRLLFAAVALLVLQALAVLVYRSVENGRGASSEAPFRHEVIKGGPILPEISLVRSNGTQLPARDLRGQRVLLHFWATWCPPCREELPALLRLGQEHRHLRVIAVAVDRDWATLRRFFGGTIPPDVVRDPSGLLVKHYRVGGLPDTYLLDRSGAAKVRFAGARDWRNPSARELLASQQ